MASGLLVIVGMALPKLLSKPNFERLPGLLRDPWHANMTLVFGTFTILFVGLAASAVWPARRSSLPS